MNQYFSLQSDTDNMEVVRGGNQYSAANFENVFVDTARF